MDTDDGLRSNSGVICSLIELENGKYRLILDDVSNSDKTTKCEWKHEVVFTWKEYDKNEIDDYNLSEKELAGLGYHILARLIALKNHRPK